MEDIDLAGLHSGHSVDERQIRPLYRLLSIILSTGPLAAATAILTQSPLLHDAEFVR